LREAAGNLGGGADFQIDEAACSADEERLTMASEVRRAREGALAIIVRSQLPKLPVGLNRRSALGMRLDRLRYP
jgi:hypothetical protein